MGREDFRSSELPKWENFINEFFSNDIPERAEWTSSIEIMEILNRIGCSEIHNHTFFPSGGGLDLSGATSSHLPGILEVNFGQSIHYIKPKKIIFHSFPDADYEWFYFRLETDALPPSGVYAELDLDYEELVELGPSQYINRVHWDSGEYNGRRLPQSARLVTRELKGDFVIFSKASLYNQNSGTYDARHNRMSDEEFKDYIIEVINQL